MELCSELHEEVCHELVRCPACETIKELQDEINNLQGELNKANETIDILVKEAE